MFEADSAQRNRQPYEPVGQNIARRDGYDKLTGRARYVDDLTFPGMLFGKTVRGRIAHGAIRRISFNPALDWSQVIVADSRDIPGRNVVALIEDDQPLLAVSRVLHYAEPILLVAAPTRELAELAVEHVEIEYDESAAVFSVEDALKADIKVHGNNNIFKQYRFSQGDVVAGFGAADHSIDGEYMVRHQERLYIETQGSI